MQLNLSHSSLHVVKLVLEDDFKIELLVEKFNDVRHVKILAIDGPPDLNGSGLRSLKWLSGTSWISAPDDLA